MAPRTRQSSMLHLPLLISAFVICKRGYAGSADPAQDPNPVLGKDTVVARPPSPAPPPNMPDAIWEPPKPVELGCLQDFAEGCHKITDRRTCLGSRDGRRIEKDANGIKIFGQPCTWCGGISCTTGSLHVCEPLDFLVKGQGKEFLDFTARDIYTVAKCNNGRPVLPDRRDPVLALADAGRHSSCGDQKVYTVPHIKDTWSNCTNFCYNKASVTWPYGLLGWNCIRAWYADGNTCHALRETTCANKFEDWMDVALCQCEGKALLTLVKPPAPVVTTTAAVTTAAPPPCAGYPFMSFCLPWWLLWLPLLLCLLCLCLLLLGRICSRKPTKPVIEREPLEEMWIRISEGTQTPASARETSVKTTRETAAVAMVQPFETVVEVVPKAEQALIQMVPQPTLFDMIDTNHDGVITRQELAKAGVQANTQSYVMKQQTSTSGLTSAPRGSVLPSEPIQNVPPSEPVMNAPPMEPVMNQGLVTGTMQVVPTTQVLTETQVLQPMQPVQGQQMDLLTVTPWGYSVNHMTQ